MFPGGFGDIVFDPNPPKEVCSGGCCAFPPNEKAELDVGLEVEVDAPKLNGGNFAGVVDVAVDVAGELKEKSGGLLGESTGYR